MAHDNVALLTKSHSAIAAKKHARRGQIKEIVFDDEARRSFLTGFHKRKVARREQAKKKAELREKQERLETRREHRRALAERAARNAAEVERACGIFGGADDDLDTGEVREVEEEYEGEEELTTVTVVQDLELTAPLDVVPRLLERTPELSKVRRSKRTAKVKYETKAARRAEWRRQRARRTEKSARSRRSQ